MGMIRALYGRFGCFGSGIFAPGLIEPPKHEDHEDRHEEMRRKCIFATDKIQIHTDEMQQAKFLIYLCSSDFLSVAKLYFFVSSWSHVVFPLRRYNQLTMQKITPFLWFNDQAEEAVNYYISIFKNSKIGKVSRYGEGSPGRPGTVMTITFELDGQTFIALNGGPVFKFTEAVSFFVNCQTQAEVDELWEKLSEGGEKGQCGWLKDRYGLSWQIVPTALGEMLQNKDAAKAKRAMQAMLQMKKIDLEKLKQAMERQ
jgi:predicted 3-demethylubiquinone-9 3-methyltransferase (glyoxalase superfamily)